MSILDSLYNHLNSLEDVSEKEVVKTEEVEIVTESDKVIDKELVVNVKGKKKLKKDN